MATAPTPRAGPPRVRVGHHDQLPVQEGDRHDPRLAAQLLDLALDPDLLPEVQDVVGVGVDGGDPRKAPRPHGHAGAAPSGAPTCTASSLAYRGRTRETPPGLAASFPSSRGAGAAGCRGVLRGRAGPRGGGGSWR